MKWLSKDIIFVATDSIYGDESIKLWLERYHYFHTGNDFEVHENLTTTLKKKDLFYRGGEIRGALSLDFYANSFTNLVVVPGFLFFLFLLLFISFILFYFIINKLSLNSNK